MTDTNLIFCSTVEATFNRLVVEYLSTRKHSVLPSYTHLITLIVRDEAVLGNIDVVKYGCIHYGADVDVATLGLILESNLDVDKKKLMAHFLYQYIKHQIDTTTGDGNDVIVKTLSPHQFKILVELEIFEDILGLYTLSWLKQIREDTDPMFLKVKMCWDSVDSDRRLTLYEIQQQFKRLSDNATVDAISELLLATCPSFPLQIDTLELFTYYRDNKEKKHMFQLEELLANYCAAKKR
jgi:hypothetical protein